MRIWCDVRNRTRYCVMFFSFSHHWNIFEQSILLTIKKDKKTKLNPIQDWKQNKQKNCIKASCYCMHTEYGEEEPDHFLRAKAAAIPPAKRPTAVAVMPIPITPSAIRDQESFYITDHFSDWWNGFKNPNNYQLPFAILSSMAFFNTKACLQSGWN